MCIATCQSYDGENCVLLLYPCKVNFVKSSHILTIISTGACREPLIEGPKGESSTDVYFAPYSKQDTTVSLEN